MSGASGETIVQFGDPLGFKVRPGTARSPVIVGSGADVFKVEARTMSGHQKEAFVTEGATGSVWRLASDEGRAMKGDDLGPFPLGFFSAGVMGDISNRIRRCAQERRIALETLRIHMSHLFGADGSFIHSTAKAYSESVDLRIELEGNIQPEDARLIVDEAFLASPAVALLRHPMRENMFALYINGRRRKMIDRPNSAPSQATDPFLVYKNPPRPFDREGRTDLIRKTGVVEEGDTTPVPLTTTDKRFFIIEAEGETIGEGGEFETDTWIARPGMSHFKMISDESKADVGPSGLGLMSAGIGLCFLTQLLRYIDAQKLKVFGARLVQFNPYSSGTQGRPGPIDTHLFLNGEAPDEVHLNLLTIAAHTCFMHVAAATPLEPKVTLVANGHECLQNTGIPFTNTVSHSGEENRASR